MALPKEQAFCSAGIMVRMLVALLLLVFAIPAAAAPGVQARLSRGEAGAWLLDYDFAYRSPVWFFQRSANDLSGQPWRPRSWLVETPGVRLERVGNYDALVSDRPLGRVRIRMQPSTEPLNADYTPALRFSDGGIALYSGHFALAPRRSRAEVASLPPDLNGVPLVEPPVVLDVVDPGRRLLVEGRATRGRARLWLYQTDTYVYSGDAPLIENEAFAGVLDPELPGWISAELGAFTPRLMRFYRERLGAPKGGRPMALAAWRGSERKGYSFGGSVLPGMVAMQMSGAGALAPNQALLDGMRWFIGHESAHFWMGQTVRYDRRGDAWIMEGAADLLAIRALERLAPGYDGAKILQQELGECVALVEAGESLAGAEGRGEYRAPYACGAMLFLAAEGAMRRAGKGDGFDFVRGLVEANRADGVVTTADWVARFEAVAGGDQGREVRRFFDQGVADPRGFWTRLFAATGVGLTVPAAAS